MKVRSAGPRGPQMGIIVSGREKTAQIAGRGRWKMLSRLGEIILINPLMGSR